MSCRARALVDAAARIPIESQMRAAMIGAIQQRMVRTHDVAHWVEARQPNGRIRLRAALSEAMAGVWSVPEGDLIRLLRTSKVLPEVLANPELRDSQGRRLTTPDVWIDDVAMAVMVHSREFHEESLDWEATIESDGDLAAARVLVLPTTPGSIARDPARVLHRVEQAYLSARRSGFRAPVVATRREGWLTAS